MKMPILLETNLPNLYRRGKVRDTYDLGEKLLIIATDRLSAFDVVLPTGIPDKGRVLNLLSDFWFQKTAVVVPNHFLYVVEGRRIVDLPYELPQEVIGRSMVVLKAQRVDVECVVRGYLFGSAWQEYRETGTVGGQRLPSGLVEAQELPEPIFTPATKAETGHDVNITFEQLADVVGHQVAAVLRLRSLALYRFAAEYARQRGIIIADSKFEFGWLQNELIVIDELLTPDSSRFWPADNYEPGRSPPSFDKQYVRDWLIASGWNKEPPAPELPPDVVERTAEKYREVYRRLTGRELP
ncbi:MAG TPA: phosphoribosylaminoimidazolesuccinocarboxamide synthase [Dehalococcoidia bacterium]|nr:phosphoribosylaminoimidazolesuccinocarboxamide synthase [Dehalococcoidia bacterium]